MPGRHANKYTEPFTINRGTLVKAIADKPGYAGFVYSNYFHFIPVKRILYSRPVYMHFNGNDSLALADGKTGLPGVNNQYWVGFDSAAEIIMLLTEPMTIKSITARFMQDKWQIYLPASVEYLVSANGNTYKSVFSQKIKSEKSHATNTLLPAVINENDIAFIKLRFTTIGYTKDKAGSKKPVLTFIDEIFVE